MSLPFKTLDVFTTTPYTGNPLAVVTISPGITLTQRQKQLIARQFNLSETTFVHEIDKNEGDASPERRFDIFTRTAELPFAGHPTIGTAAAVWGDGVRRLRAKAGVIQIESESVDGSVDGVRRYRAAIPFDVRLHEQRVPFIQHGDESIPEGIRAAEGGAPLFAIVNGMTFALIELPSVEVLGSLRTGGASKLPELPEELLDDGWRSGWVTRRYYFVRLGSEVANGKTVYKLRTRLVRRDMEDPGTGSAACALASYLSLHILKEEREIGFEITQGVEMGRVNRISVDVEVAELMNGKRKLEKLYLGGSAVQVMNGSLVIPE
ncbi:hypothetical protein BJY04DRAFT_182580 [Aspergillus karnatakaensis]|uniref:PhzF family phenazine biosynthesis protein n=1 Tax=Aspergillus karnatakaensis TaxID=1810916 RepID=UPI003CCE4481